MENRRTLRVSVVLCKLYSSLHGSLRLVCELEIESHYEAFEQWDPNI